MKLRSFTLEDAALFATLANNAKIAGKLTDRFPHPYTLDNAKQFITMVLESKPHHVLGIEVDGALAGAIGVHPQNDVWSKNAEMGYWLAEPYWGKGIMTKAIKEMVNYGFNNFDINRIFARPFGRNVASQKVLMKCGFNLEAKLIGTIVKNGQVEDEWIFGFRWEMLNGEC